MTPLGLESAGLAFLAGLTSVASPCVLPVVPLLVTGTAEDHRWRPALVVGGLAASFVSMGALMALFGGALGPLIPRLERGVGVLLVAFGILLLAGVNLFRRLSWLQSIPAPGAGRWSGFLLGATLGLVWIPCVGPILSGVLATVAASGSVPTGVALLGTYAAGFAVPMLAVGYGSRAARQRIRVLAEHPLAVRWASGLVLVAFGVLVLKKGMLFAGM